MYILDDLWFVKGYNSNIGKLPGRLSDLLTFRGPGWLNELRSWIT